MLLRLASAASVALAIVVSGCVGSPAPAGGNETAPSGTEGGQGAPGSPGSSGNNTCVLSSNSCQGGSAGAGGNGTQTATGKIVELAVATAGQYPANPSFAPATLSAAAGSMIRVTLTNGDTVQQVPLIEHDWVLEGVSGAKTATVAPGAKTEVSFAAPKAGAYKYFCSIGDHRERGMEGTLTVA
jgi:plastocyanin